MGKVEKAIEVQLIMLRYPAVANATWYEENCWHSINMAAASLSPGLVQATQDRVQQQDLFSITEELLSEFFNQSGDE